MNDSLAPVSLTLLVVLRRMRRLSQNDVAKAVGTSQATFSRIEAGESQPSPELGARIAEYFCRNSIDDLLERLPFRDVEIVDVEREVANA